MTEREVEIPYAESAKSPFNFMSNGWTAASADGLRCFRGKLRWGADSGWEDANSSCHGVPMWAGSMSGSIDRVARVRYHTISFHLGTMRIPRIADGDRAARLCEPKPFVWPKP
jgi:hypothetical protein